MQADLAERTALLVTLADGARKIALHFFHCDDLGVELKADASPVTQADRAIEQFLRDTILAAFPTDALLGEEYGDHAGSSAYRWIIDPIDGTVSFANGVPLFGILIALEAKALDGTRTVVAGVADYPALHERVTAILGEGAHWIRDGQSTSVARVRPCATLADALVCTSGSEYYIKSARVNAFHRLALAARRIRGWSDCYGLLLVATGRADAVVDPIMHPWDIGPYAIILPEAGGVLTDWSGITRLDGGDAIACAPTLADELRRVLRD